MGFSYVDDTDLFQTGATPIEVLVSIQELIASFGSLLKIQEPVLTQIKVGFIWWILHGRMADGSQMIQGILLT